jgi:hypothetical protein
MRPELKQKFDKEASKAKHKNFPAWSIAFLVFIIIVWLVIGFSSQGSVAAYGTAVSQHASFTKNEGNKIYLMVKLADRKSLVKVLLPKHLPIKRNVKVELREHQSTLFDTIRYTFVRYVE